MPEQHENIILLALVCYGGNGPTEQELAQILFDAGLPGTPPLTQCEVWVKDALARLARNECVEQKWPTWRLLPPGSHRVSRVLVRQLMRGGR